MMVGGIILLVIGVLGFLAVCIYAACMMPVWSAGRLADGGTDAGKKEETQNNVHILFGHR